MSQYQQVCSSQNTFHLIHTNDDQLAQNLRDGLHSVVSSTDLPDPNSATPTATSSTSAGASTHDSFISDLEGGAESIASKRRRLMAWFSRNVPVRNTYQRLHNGWTSGRMLTDRPGRFVGHGTDGVFRNLVAKPDANTESELFEQWPPLYDDAAADTLPEYWELAVVLSMYDDEVFVEGLPVGNLALFVWNALVLVAFQWVGFLLCYLLHTSHGAKQGARAGLGITLVLAGWKLVPSNFGRADRTPPRFIIDNPMEFDILHESQHGHLDTYTPTGSLGPMHMAKAASFGPTPYFAYGVVALGVLVTAFSFIDFWKVKRTERELLAPRAEPATTSVTEEVQS